MLRLSPSQQTLLSSLREKVLTLPTHDPRWGIADSLVAKGLAKRVRLGPVKSTGTDGSVNVSMQDAFTLTPKGLLWKDARS